MANQIYEFDPVSWITAGALGKPGHRTFYIQAEHGLDRLTLICEKEQVEALAEAIDELLANLAKEFSLELEPVELDEMAMSVKEPAEPLFRVGSMGLGYDRDRDRILLVVQELIAEDEERDPLECRLFTTREQMKTVSLLARQIVQKGRTTEQRALQGEAQFRRNGHSEH
jgi:uncharacterized repeat protein (TIGR03847 family)